MEGAANGVSPFSGSAMTAWQISSAAVGGSGYVANEPGRGGGDSRYYSGSSWSQAASRAGSSRGAGGTRKCSSEVWAVRRDRLDVMAMIADDFSFISGTRMTCVAQKSVASCVVKSQPSWKWQGVIFSGHRRARLQKKCNSD